MQAHCALLCQQKLCLQHLILLAQVQDHLGHLTATAVACLDKEPGQMSCTHEPEQKGDNKEIGDRRHDEASTPVKYDPACA